MQQAARAGVPVHAMIRPRAGDFVFSQAEIDVMAADIATARECGMAGVVLGASLPDGRLDEAALHILAGEASGLSLTLHRVFDLVPDMAEALEAAVRLGFHRVLTSGGAATAVAGIDRLVALKRQAEGRIGILPGAGITAATAPALRALEPDEVHGSCSVARAGRQVGLGFGVGTERVADAGAVRALRTALQT
jgi:copper homeostasis protein